MPYHDAEYPGQPLWQSVLLFCCKGMIEGIMVILFFWLLVQVLFTKQLEVHLQILLLVGLIIFCLSLVLGCIFCWWKMPSTKDIEPVMSTPGHAGPVTLAQNPPPSASTMVLRQQYEELDGDILTNLSTFTSSASSKGEFVPRSLTSHSGTASEMKEHPPSPFSLHRLSTPLFALPLYKPIDPSHDALPRRPKLGMASKTCKALQRRCTVTGDGVSYYEHSRAASLTAASPSMPEELIPLAPLCKQPALPKPCLHFTMAFSLEQQTLTVIVLSLTETSHTLEEVSVLSSLPPVHPCPRQASVPSNLRPESHSLVLDWKVSSVKELQRCILRLAVHIREPTSLTGSFVGELEMECGGRDWKGEQTLHFRKELNPSKCRLNTSLISQEELVCKGARCHPQIFILLQYQTLAHRIKVTVLRADDLDHLTHTSATSDYQLVINLHHDGAVISSSETKGGANNAWNTPFLFDLPQETSVSCLSCWNS